ncbi:uncharacterized protein [Equus asinus]|uniref:uncharacterized protein n=1 Tax=Equus asinus TaxID=9793 RepID=UPI0038F78D63
MNGERKELVTRDPCLVKLEEGENGEPLRKFPNPSKQTRGVPRHPRPKLPGRDRQSTPPPPATRLSTARRDRRAGRGQGPEGAGRVRASAGAVLSFPRGRRRRRASQAPWAMRPGRRRLPAPSQARPGGSPRGLSSSSLSARNPPRSSGPSALWAPRLRSGGLRPLPARSAPEAASPASSGRGRELSSWLPAQSRFVHQSL